ncbi:hypothetical protein GLOIN_2v1825428 [Rhizophagus irregularis DAOM 181602=DAOM 197198]|nr:hypothetical protein GLOIN_2v1825428 [Rhizophagus irregularis DAOM 181602=DAOM 197198]
MTLKIHLKAMIKFLMIMIMDLLRSLIIMIMIIQTESGTSEEYDGFEEFEITAEKENKIWDDKLIQGLRLLHVKVLHSISDEAFNKISNQLEQCSKPLTTN